MLDKEYFYHLYDTTYNQIRPESYLEEVSEEDREIFADWEILTGFDCRGNINKFNQTGRNKGKKYKTQRVRLDNELKKYVDGKISRGEMYQLWDNIFEKANAGDPSLMKLLVDRFYGKVKEQIEVKTEGEVTFVLSPDKNAIERQKDNLEKEETSE